MNKNLYDKYRTYLNTRVSNYEFRCIRYNAVANKLELLGLRNDDTIVDVGSGFMDFCKYMRAFGWKGDYIPIDAALDGTDLNYWVPPRKHAFFVAIEVVEHVYEPLTLMKTMVEHATKGVVATTPNCEMIDVLACDPTHVSIIEPETWIKQGWEIERKSLFNVIENDSIVAWKKAEVIH